MTESGAEQEPKTPRGWQRRAVAMTQGAAGDEEGANDGDDNNVIQLKATINRVLKKNNLGDLLVVYHEMDERAHGTVIDFYLPHTSLATSHYDLLVDACRWDLPNPPFSLIKKRGRFEEKLEGRIVTVDYHVTMVVRYTSLVITDRAMGRIYRGVAWGFAVVFVLFNVFRWLIAKDLHE